MGTAYNKRNKWTLAIGITGRDLCYTFVTLFLLTYVQYTGLFETQAQFLTLTLIIVACRVWDAINDPLMGRIIANTETRLGKYRPYVLGGAILSAIFLPLMFSVRFENGWHNVAFVGTMYLAWGMAYTMNDISFWGLLPALTSDKKERDNLTTLVVAFASIGAFTSGGLVPILTSKNQVASYRNISIIWTAIFLACQFLVFFAVHDNEQDAFIVDKDKIDRRQLEKVNIKEMFHILFSNKQLLVAAVAIFLYSLASSVLNAFGLNFFYFKFGYPTATTTSLETNGAVLMTLFTVIYGLSTLIAQISYDGLAKKYTRRTLMHVSFGMLAVGYAAFFIIANLLSGMVCFAALLVVSFAIFVGQGIVYVVFLIMLTNTIEYGHLQTGRDNTAITFTARPFMVKLSGAVQYGLVALTLTVTGLYPITQNVGKIEVAMNLLNENAATETVCEYLSSQSTATCDTAVQLIKTAAENNTTTETLVNQLKDFAGTLFSVDMRALAILVFSMTIIPLLLFLLAVVMVRRHYIIDEKMYEHILAELKKGDETYEK